jgi:peptidoglycan/LPS O-acetylase OafA/YrhL
LAASCHGGDSPGAQDIAPAPPAACGQGRDDTGARTLAAPGGRIEDIEILRAVAITLVLIEHSFWNLVFDSPALAHLLRVLPMWCGVDLFFAVSGFVITRGLRPALQSGSRPGPVLWRFWTRRAFRLWPASWFWLGLIVLGAVVFRQPPLMGTLALNLRGALAGVFGFADIRFALNGFAHAYGASFPYWSLSLEEQFYLLLPLLMLRARRHLPLVVALLLLLQLPLAHNRLYFFMRTDSLLWGVLLASSPQAIGLGRAAARRLATIPASGLIVLAASIAGMSHFSPWFEQAPPFELGILAAFAALPVWLAGANANLFHCGVLQPGALWLGSRSYALYLCHVPVFQCAAALSHWWPPMAGIFAGHADLGATLVGLPLLALAAEFTCRVVETPLRRLGARLTAGPRLARDSF